jgi:hypothetical protein
MGWGCSMNVKEKKWVENPEEGDHLEHLGIDGSIILKWILKK